MSEIDAFESYNWEEDSDWQNYWKSIDQDTLNNKPLKARESWIKKKKIKWYKQHVNPMYEPPLHAKPPPQPQQTQQEPEENEEHFIDHAAFTWRWYFYLFCNCWSVIAVPLIPFAPWKAYRSIVVANAAVYGHNLLHVHGRPKFQKYYLKCMFLDENLFHFTYPLMCMIFNPGLVWIFPMLLRTLPLANSQLQQLISYKLPGIYEHVEICFNPIEERRIRWTSLSYTVEVWTAILMIPGTILTRGNLLISAVMYWQFLRMKFMMSGKCRIAFRDANSMIRNFLPAPILSFYDLMTRFLHKMGDLEYLKGQGSIGRGCSVM